MENRSDCCRSRMMSVVYVLLRQRMFLWEPHLPVTRYFAWYVNPMCRWANRVFVLSNGEQDTMIHRSKKKVKIYEAPFDAGKYFTRVPIYHG